MQTTGNKWLPNQEQAAFFNTMTQNEMSDYREEMADRTIIAAVKSIQEIGRASDLQAYSRHPKISHRFGEKYAIKMSFALHMGQAFECAIGSEFKVDASYLSTDLQILSRIDQLCDVYDRTILISGDLQNIMSDRAKEITRKIETITMKESPTTKRVSLALLFIQVIYCIDIEKSENMYLDDSVQLLPGEFYKHADVEGALNLYITKGVEYVFQVDHDFVCMKRAMRSDFLDSFDKAIRAYVDGDWINAQATLNVAL